MTDKDIAKLISCYKEGEQMTKICSAFGVSKKTVYAILKANKVPLRNYKIHEVDGCPLYKNDVYQNIYCDDNGPWQFLTLSFVDKRKKNEYKRHFCNSPNYKHCKIYRMLNNT